MQRSLSIAWLKEAEFRTYTLAGEVTDMGSWLGDLQHGGAFPASQMGYRGTGKWIGFRGLLFSSSPMTA